MFALKSNKPTIVENREFSENSVLYIGPSNTVMKWIVEHCLNLLNGGSAPGYYRVSVTFVLSKPLSLKIYRYL